jgi:hypothetical protein
MAAVSKKVVIATDGTATVTDATLVDIFSTVISQDAAVTGMYGLIQKAGLVVGGMSIQNVRAGRPANPFKV